MNISWNVYKNQPCFYTGDFDENEEKVLQENIIPSPLIYISDMNQLLIISTLPSSYLANTQNN